MTMSITCWCTVDSRGPSRVCSCMCETEQKGSERPQIRTSLQLIRNYCWASKSMSWDNLPNILQERNTSKSGWKFLFQTQSTLAPHSWLWLSWGRFCLLVRAFSTVCSDFFSPLSFSPSFVHSHVMKAKFHINKHRAVQQLWARAFSRNPVDEWKPPEPPDRPLLLSHSSRPSDVEIAERKRGLWSLMGPCRPCGNDTHCVYLHEHNYGGLFWWQTIN